MMDQYNAQHLLPFFLSKITNKDQTILSFNEEGDPVRGLRTFGELAHYVRCFPYQSREGLFSADKLWCSPDYMLTQKSGSEDDHCLLMTSLFRTCKWEDANDFEQFRKQEREKTILRKDRDKELLEVNVDAGGEGEEEGATGAGETTGGQDGKAAGDG